MNRIAFVLLLLAACASSKPRPDQDRVCKEPLRFDSGKFEACPEDGEVKK